MSRRWQYVRFEARPLPLGVVHESTPRATVRVAAGIVKHREIRLAREDALVDGGLGRRVRVGISIPTARRLLMAHKTFEGGLCPLADASSPHLPACMDGCSAEKHVVFVSN